MIAAAEEKKELRRALAAASGALGGDYIAASDDAIYERLAAMPEFLSAERILFYYSVNREPDTLRAVERALRLGKTVCLPESLPGGIMNARRVGGLGELVPARYGIPAPPEGAVLVSPEELDLIIVPAAAFDGSGRRLGRGGGYYDRYLPRSAALKIGLSRDALVLDSVPAEDFDARVDCLVTDKRVLRRLIARIRAEAGDGH
ncbi:MAG: 5-formyltetrahydrofolate cyclo-ligase [Oscillospiraceae bacterium]|jgi:5-formyltetrahydrofolate cyclo-ligase|nr:5-formyltetrahydrofolate cyclo-ligase [Oscillospiraceae bacterium]